MKDKLSPAQFYSIYSESTGDCAGVKKWPNIGALLLKLTTLAFWETFLPKFDNFWDITREELEELHALTLDDGHYAEKANGEVIINLALEILLRSLY